MNQGNRGNELTCDQFAEAWAVWGYFYPAGLPLTEGVLRHRANCPSCHSITYLSHDLPGEMSQLLHCTWGNHVLAITDKLAHSPNPQIRLAVIHLITTLSPAIAAGWRLQQMLRLVDDEDRVVQRYAILGVGQAGYGRSDLAFEAMRQLRVIQQRHPECKKNIEAALGYCAFSPGR